LRFQLQVECFWFAEPILNLAPYLGIEPS